MIQIDKTHFSQRRGGPMVMKIRFAADSENEALTGIPYTQRGGALVLQNKESVQWYPGAIKFIVDATYEGLLEDPPADMDEYMIDGEFREEKIETFPKPELLVTEYGAYKKNGEILFRETLDASAGSATGLPRQGSGSEVPNPLFGVKTYPVFYEVAEWSFVRKNIPPSIQRLRGKTVDRLPAGFRYDGEAKLWFVDKVPRRTRGNSWSGSVRYKQIDDTPHIKALQDLINGSGRGSGLRTGGLTITGL